ncbi:MAG: Inner rane transporter permease protein YejE, partial [Pseudomonadota bacterium]
MSGWIRVSNSTDHSLPPLKRAWLRFRSNRLGFYSAVLFSAMFFVSLFAEVISNDKPLLAGYKGNWYVPIIQTIPETAFGGDFDTPTDFLDPFIQAEFDKKGNWAIYTLNPYHHSTLNYFAKSPHPAPPSADNWLGTDDRGRDVVARLLYGFRISVLFALALTIFGTVIGVLTGA